MSPAAAFIADAFKGLTIQHSIRDRHNKLSVLALTYHSILRSIPSYFGTMVTGDYVGEIKILDIQRFYVKSPTIRDDLGWELEMR